MSDIDDHVGRSGQLIVDIVDHLKDDDAPAVLTALGAIAVIELDRFGVTIEQFTATLWTLKAGRDSELSRQRREN